MALKPELQNYSLRPSDLLNKILARPTFCRGDVVFCEGTRGRDLAVLGAPTALRTLPSPSAISFGRHHRLRARGVGNRERPQAERDPPVVSQTQSPVFAQSSPRVASRRPSSLFKMGFFNDKSGNPAYILAEKVRYAYDTPQVYRDDPTRRASRQIQHAFFGNRKRVLLFHVII